LLGIFEVRPDLPADFATGIFQGSARYPVIARTSNGVNGMTSDKTPSTRGLAIKLLDVEKVLAPFHVPAEEMAWAMPKYSGMQQDFSFLNGSAFIIKDLPTYVAFTEGVRDGKPLGAFVNLDPSHPRFKPMQFKTFVDSVLQSVKQPMQITYYGQLPHKFRDTAAKYRLDPCEGSKPTVPASGGDNQLRDNLKKTLEKDSICYALSVILQKDAVAQPIEDSNIEWLSSDEDIAAGRRFANRTEVGRFLFPPQMFDSPGMEAKCEKLSFNPWHSLNAHRPLGNMQRARKAVYLAGAKYRDANIEAQRPEPIHAAYLENLSSYGLQSSASK
jgi:hypothetical protein